MEISRQNFKYSIYFFSLSLRINIVNIKAYFTFITPFHFPEKAISSNLRGRKYN